MDDLEKAFQDYAAPKAAEPEAAKEQAAPEPEAAAPEAKAEAQAEPEAKAEGAEDEVKTEEPARDDKGRFVKVAVHAREMAAKNDRIAELERQLQDAQGKEGRKPQSLESLNALRAKLKDEAPEFVTEIIDALEAELVTRDEKVKAYESTIEQYTQAEAARAAETKAQLLAKVPVLNEWSQAADDSEQKALWQRAVLHEQQLRESGLTKWEDNEARFRQAALRAAEDLGIELKPEQIGRKPSPQSAAPTVAPSKPKGPTSLSQVGGRTPPDPGRGFDGSFTSALHRAPDNFDDAERFFFQGR